MVGNINMGSTNSITNINTIGSSTAPVTNLYATSATISNATVTGNLNMDGGYITNATALGTVDNFIPYSYIDSASLSNPVVLGVLHMNWHNITNVNGIYYGDGNAPLTIKGGRGITGGGGNVVLKGGHGMGGPDGYVSIESILHMNSNSITNTAHIYPASSNTYDLGSTNMPWRDVYSSGNLSIAGTLTLTNSVWDDLTLSAFSLYDPAGPAGAITVVATNSLWVKQFKPGDSGYCIAQMKHSYKAGTAINPHLHTYSTNAAPTTNTWTLGITAGQINGGMTNHYTDSVTFTNQSGVHAMVQFTNWPTSALKESTILGLVVSNTGPDSSLLMDIDLHFEEDKIGSDNPAP